MSANRINLFGVGIDPVSRSQAVALVGEWVREWRIPNTEYRIPNKKSNSLHSVFSIQNSVLFPKIITTPNPEIIVAAQNDPEFLKALRSADLAIPDGIGVVWALKLLKSNTGSKSNTSNTSKRAAVGCETRATCVTCDTCVTSLQRLSGLDLMESLICDLPRTLLQGLSSKESPLKVMLVGGKPGVAQAAAKILSENSISKTVKQYHSKTVVGKTVNQYTGSPAYRSTDYTSRLHNMIQLNNNTSV